MLSSCASAGISGARHPRAACGGGRSVLRARPAHAANAVDGRFCAQRNRPQSDRIRLPGTRQRPYRIRHRLQRGCARPHSPRRARRQTDSNRLGGGRERRADHRREARIERGVAADGRTQGNRHFDDGGVSRGGDGRERSLARPGAQCAARIRSGGPPGRVLWLVRPGAFLEERLFDAYMACGSAPI